MKLWPISTPAPDSRDAACTPEAQVELARLRKAVIGLADLPRRAFTLRIAYGFSHEGIARRLQISEHEVEQHLATAIRHIAHRLPPEKLVS